MKSTVFALLAGTLLVLSTFPALVASEPPNAPLAPSGTGGEGLGDGEVTRPPPGRA